jgi:hypothetical protein
MAANLEQTLIILMPERIHFYLLSTFHFSTFGFFPGVFSSAPMWQPGHVQWWILLVTTLLIVALWPPSEDRSLAIKFVNWAVDPRDRLPTLPGPLAIGLSDDPAAVDAHDLQTRTYDELYEKGGWNRTRLELKVARDPLNPSTERQLLVALGVLTAFLVWRFGARKK